jgi:hypothetical protein
MVPRFRGGRHAILALALGVGVGLCFASWVLGQPAASPTQAAPSSSSLTGRALTSFSARLEEVLPAATGRVVILRDGRVLESVLFAGRDFRYTDYLLWASTTYRYETRALDLGGRLLESASVQLTTPPQRGAFPLLYSATSFWNVPVTTDAAVDQDSAAMTARALVAYASSASLVTSDRWGMPLAYASSLSAQYPVRCTRYDCDTPVVFHIPTYARPTTGSDHHLVVIDPGVNEELDLWLADHDPDSDRWSAGSRFVTDPSGWGAACAPQLRCHGAVAAGLAAFGGVVRPEEIAQGHIDHALFFADPFTRRGYIACPAAHTDGVSDDGAAIPEGARIQLDPAFDVDGQPWPRWQKVVAHALQTYGAYLGDTGGTLGFVAEASLERGYDAWSLVGVPRVASLANLPWSHVRVLRLERC